MFAESGARARCRKQPNLALVRARELLDYKFEGSRQFRINPGLRAPSSAVAGNEWLGGAWCLRSVCCLFVRSASGDPSNFPCGRGRGTRKCTKGSFAAEARGARSFAERHICIQRPNTPTAPQSKKCNGASASSFVHPWLRLFRR